MSRLYPQSVTMQPAHWQLGRGLRSRQEADKAAAQRACPALPKRPRAGRRGAHIGDKHAAAPLQKQLRPDAQAAAAGGVCDGGGHLQVLFLLTDAKPSQCA